MSVLIQFVNHIFTKVLYHSPTRNISIIIHVLYASQKAYINTRQWYKVSVNEAFSFFGLYKKSPGFIFGRQFLLSEVKKKDKEQKFLVDFGGKEGEKYEGLFCCLHLQLMTEEESTFWLVYTLNCVVAAGKQIPFHQIQWQKWVNKPAGDCIYMNPFLSHSYYNEVPFPAFYVAIFPIKLLKATIMCIMSIKL